MDYRMSASHYASDGGEEAAFGLVDNLQLSAGLRYLRTEIGDETRGVPIPQYPSPLVQYPSSLYRLSNDVGASNEATSDTSNKTTSDASSEPTHAIVKEPLEFGDLATELRNKIYTYYAQDTDNIPAGPAEIGRSVRGNYIHPHREGSFNLNILLVSRTMSQEALPIIKAELSTRRFILTNHDGGVLQSRVEQYMLRIFGDCIQTVTLNGGGMMDVLSALGPRRLKTLDIMCTSHRVYRKVRVNHELEEDDWTRALVEVALHDNAQAFIQIFVDNTDGVPLILAGYAGAAAVYPKVFVPEREWQVRYVLPVRLELEKGDDFWAWRFKVWFEGDFGRVVKYVQESG